MSGLADGLALAASPIWLAFALMSAMQADRMAAICSAVPGVASTGMTAMYLVMSGIHLSPWIRWVGRVVATSRAGGLR